MIQRLLITGGSGDLGGVLSETALNAGWNVYSTYLSHPDRIRAGNPIYCNLTEPEHVRRLFGEVVPDVVIHCAITEVSNAFETAIGIAADLLWRYMPPTARLITLSSDMVFNGRQPPYSENAPTTPLTPYGRAKARMEKSAPGLIVRTSLIYDFDMRNKQVAWMLTKMRNSEQVRLYTDEYRSPIWAADLAAALLDLAERDEVGVLNLAGPETMSRFDLGRGLLLALGYNADNYIMPASLAGTGRPPDLTLDTTRAAMLLGRSLLTFTQAESTWNATQHAAEHAQPTL